MSDSSLVETLAFSWFFVLLTPSWCAGLLMRHHHFSKQEERRHSQPDFAEMADKINMRTWHSWMTIFVLPCWSAGRSFRWLSHEYLQFENYGGDSIGLLRMRKKQLVTIWKCAQHTSFVVQWIFYTIDPQSWFWPPPPQYEPSLSSANLNKSLSDYLFSHSTIII